MNKWLGFPLVVMVCLLFISILIGNALSSGSISVNNQNYTFNVGTPTSILLILSTAVAAVTIAGITIFGSGFSTMAQEVILKSIAYGGVWAILTAVNLVLFANIGEIGYLILVGLSLCYMVGFVADLGGS